MITTSACFCLSTAVVYGSDAICTDKDNEFKKAFDAVAKAVQLMVNYEMAHWVDQNNDFAEQNVSETQDCTGDGASKIACTVVRDNPLLATLTANKDSGVFNIVFKAGKDINPLLRGASVTISPEQCHTTAASVQECAKYGKRTTENTGAESVVSENNRPPSKWSCNLTGPQSDYRNFTLNSVTCNFIEQSDSGFPDNTFKTICASGLVYAKGAVDTSLLTGDATGLDSGDGD